MPFFAALRLCARIPIGQGFATDGAGSEPVVNNGRRARLEYLRLVEASASEDRRIEVEHESTGGEINGLALGDVDGDGTQDLLMLSARGKLMIRLLGHEKTKPHLPDIEVGIGMRQDCLRAGFEP
ncbi:MAG: hypothetical protein ACE5F1_06570 [Planctomycetota bacterium]